MTAATDAPVEERHRRAAAEAYYAHEVALRRVPDAIGSFLRAWSVTSFRDVLTGQVRYSFHDLASIAQAIANAERDGRASRDAEVAELQGKLETALDELAHLRWWLHSETGNVEDGDYLGHVVGLGEELKELRAYKRAWKRLEDVATSAPPLMATTGYAIAACMCSLLAEELAQKGTP